MLFARRLMLGLLLLILLPNDQNRSFAMAAAANSKATNYKYDANSKSQAATTTEAQEDYRIEVWQGRSKNVVPSLNCVSDKQKPYFWQAAPKIDELKIAGGNQAKTNSHCPPQSCEAGSSSSFASGSSNNDLITQRGNVSEFFTREIKAALSTIPVPYQKILLAAGYKVVASTLLNDTVPGVSDQQVRGYEPSTTWRSVYGMFNRTERLVVMAEFASKAGSKNPTTLNNKTRRIGILRHEFGHAIDQHLGNFSHTKEFLQAYWHGVAALSAAEKSRLSYFLQPGDAGAEETFAELFACMNGQGCDHRQDAALKEHFSEAIALIKERLKKLIE